jgi:hypothetical protein
MTTPTDNVKTEDIRLTQPEPTVPDERAKKEEAFYDHQYRTQQAELGAIGRFIGCNSEKPGNISFIVLLLCLIVICLAMFFELQHFEKILTAFVSVITLALGYLFGSSTKHN